ncbi:O-antigen ligase family protein [Candidatus Saccharibacteria bacterium]|nr:O-antigen ligase family protein [Candidatus Saccharibacteria bacterium]
MKNLSKKLTRIFLLALPPALFFSYYPVISLAETSTMNLEFSIAEIWLILFFIASLPQLLDFAKFYGAKKLLLVATIPTYFFLTILWSANQLRALLTAGIFTLIVYAALYIIYILKRHSSLLRPVAGSLIISAVVVSIFCWAQCIMDLAGVSREYTMLCRGCVSSTFGFPHPNGFAIEPQFMGNLLIAPVLLCFYLVSAKNNRKIIPVALFLTATLFLTFSRGAIYAVIAGFVIEQILIKIRLNQTRSKASRPKSGILKSAAIIIVGLFISLCAQGIFATLSPTSDNFISGVTKSIHQLTLGKLDLRPESVKEAESQKAQGTQAAQDPQGQATQAEDSSSFSGYVAESTDTRLGLNGLAFKTWLSSPKYIAAGTGLGSAGIAMHEFAPEEIGPKEIVQNQYVSLLLETGSIGLILIAVTILLFIKSTKLVRAPGPLFISVLLSFLLTLLFFSGLPNAIHIYLFLAIVFMFDLSKNYAIIEQEV